VIVAFSGPGAQSVVCVGIAGTSGTVVITTFAEPAETHPAELVTVKLYIAGDSPVIVVLDPEPVTAPGLIVQFPAGNPFNMTLPEATVQVGSVIVPTAGAVGVDGATLITIFPDNGEVHPASFVTE
jgi:hypothetical protein